MFKLRWVLKCGSTTGKRDVPLSSIASGWGPALSWRNCPMLSTGCSYFRGIWWWLFTETTWHPTNHWPHPRMLSGNGQPYHPVTQRLLRVAHDTQYVGDAGSLGTFRTLMLIHGLLRTANLARWGQCNAACGLWRSDLWVFYWCCNYGL